MATASAGNRISGLDTARSLAIALAMVSHCFIHFGVWPQLASDVGLLARLLTRSATPTFIILFGMMLEIVYLKLIRRGDRPACWQRLLTRAIQCYLLYLCVVVAGVIGGKLSPGEGARAALFLSQAYFANILKFYSLGLLFGLLLVELRARYGLRAAGAVLLLIWLAYPLLKAAPPLPESVAHLASFLFGIGDETGPSVLQGMSLVILGLFLGKAVHDLRSEVKAQRRQANRLLAAILLLTAAALAALLLTAGVRPALENFTDYGYRAANHPGYYILGSTLAMAMIAACLPVAPRLPQPVLARLNVFGISSLFAYAFGNVALNLLPTLRGGLALGLLCTFGFLLALYGATAYFQLTLQSQSSGGSLAARLGRLHGHLRGLTARLAALFVNRLLPRSPTA